MTQQDFKGCVHLARLGITQAEDAARKGEFFEADGYLQGAIAQLLAARSRLVKFRIRQQAVSLDKVIVFPNTEGAEE